MNLCNVDVIDAEDETLADFDSFIKKQEKLKVGWNDGVFKVMVAPQKPRAESPDTVIRKVVRNLTSIKKQVIAGGFSEDIFLFQSKSAQFQLKTFKEQSKDLSSYSEPTCCSEILRCEGIDSLLKHYYADVKQRAVPQSPQRNNVQDYITRGMQLKKTYETNRKSKSFFRKTKVVKWKYTEECSCIDCEHDKKFKQWDFDTDSDPEVNESTPLNGNELFYGAGIVMRDIQSQIDITEHFSIAKIDNILLLNSEDHYEGISCPYTYIGCLHTFFALHIEDASLWSINYLHLGHPKIWIVIPPKAYMLLLFHLRKSKLPLSEAACNNILGHKSTIVTPQWLNKHQIPYKVVIQKPGEAVILYPNAAHFGFNTGWNIAEAINFATESWIVDGINSPRCQCIKNSVHINMIDYIAAFRTDLLHKYLQESHIPMQRESEMARVLQESITGETLTHVNNTSGYAEESSPGNSQVVQNDDTLHPCKEQGTAKVKVTFQTKEKLMPMLKCPAKYCKRECKLVSKYQMINHIQNCHKPLVVKYNLMDRLNTQEMELKEKFK